jgi:hypothetical protein
MRVGEAAENGQVARGNSRMVCRRGVVGLVSARAALSPGEVEAAELMTIDELVARRDLLRCRVPIT